MSVIISDKTTHLWVLLSFPTDTGISIFAIITIGILLIWRYFAHYIDNDVAGNYVRIMHFEKRLEVPGDCSIYIGLIRGITKNFQNDKLRKDANGLCEDQRIELINQLHLKNRLGYRGHNFWDMIALFIMVVSVVILLTSYYLPLQISIVLSVVIIALFLSCYKSFMDSLDFQIDPTEPEFNEFIENAKKILPKNDNC